MREENTPKSEVERLFEDDSLLDTYRRAPSFFSNHFNTFVSISVALLLTVFSVVHVCIPTIRSSVVIPFADLFATWANVGSALAGTILGFLVAGFAIVCSVLRPQTMYFLLYLPNKTYGLNELKLLFVIFVEVFVQYLALLFWSILVLIFGGKIGPAMYLGTLLGKVHWLVPFISLHVIFVLWGTWLVALVLTLKSFIYNLYQSLLLCMADAIDEVERQRESQVSPNNF